MCVGGSGNRMRSFAQFIHQQLKLPGNADDIRDICEGTDRYSMYKVGPVLSISVSLFSTCGTKTCAVEVVEIVEVVEVGSICCLDSLKNEVLNFQTSGWDFCFEKALRRKRERKSTTKCGIT